MPWNPFKKKEPFDLLRSMQKLEIRDGDTLVLTYAGRLGVNQADKLKKALKELMEKSGLQIHVIVLEENMGIGILRKSN